MSDKETAVKINEHQANIRYFFRHPEFLKKIRTEFCDPSNSSAILAFIESYEDSNGEDEFSKYIKESEQGFAEQIEGFEYPQT